MIVDYPKATRRIELFVDFVYLVAIRFFESRKYANDVSANGRTCLASHIPYLTRDFLNLKVFSSFI